MQRLRAALAVGLVWTAALVWAGGARAQTALLRPELAAALISPAPATDEIALRLLDRETYAPGLGLVQWRGGQTEIARSTRSVDSLRIGVGGVMILPGGLPTGRARGEFAARDYEVMVTRTWPAALSFDAGLYDLDLSPHAGLGVSSYGGSAEAGATLRLAKAVRDEGLRRRLGALGAQDTAAIGDRGRFYLFAAASGRAVGLNMLSVDQGWSDGDWSTDGSRAFVGYTQVGLGWGEGGTQASLGYVRRQVKGQRMLFGRETRNDSLLAFSVSIRP